MIRALFVGLGSIGNRHSANLKEICDRRGQPVHITALRTHKGSLFGHDFPQIDRMITELDDTHYDLAFITNPTTLHAEAYSQIKDVADFIYIEKPIFAETSVTPEQLGMSDDRITVAAPIRFCGIYQKLKDAVAKEHVYSCRILCSSYLPDWRPKQDYRTVYSAKKALGGGVGIDLIHEMDYMVDLFGFAEETYCFHGQYSHLEIDSDDISLMICRYKDMLAEVHLDYFGRTYRRTCECMCHGGSIIADFGTGILTLPDGTVIDCSEPVNDRYIREMEAFLDFAAGKGKNAHPPSLAYRVLKLSLGEQNV